MHAEQVYDVDGNALQEGQTVSTVLGPDATVASFVHYPAFSAVMVRFADGSTESLNGPDVRLRGTHPSLPSSLPFEVVLSNGDRAKAETREAILVAARTLVADARIVRSAKPTATFLYEGRCILAEVPEHRFAEVAR